jgi:hypothetical protein
MPAVAQVTAAKARDRDWVDTSWPACEQEKLPGDGSLRWLGALMLGCSGLATSWVLYWLAQKVVTHL